AEALTIANQRNQSLQSSIEVATRKQEADELSHSRDLHRRHVSIAVCLKNLGFKRMALSADGYAMLTTERQEILISAGVVSHENGKEMGANELGQMVLDVWNSA